MALGARLSLKRFWPHLLPYLVRQVGPFFCLLSQGFYPCWPYRPHGPTFFAHLTEQWARLPCGPLAPLFYKSHI